MLILFILKLNRTVRLYIDYYDLNKIIIKNYYLLLLVITDLILAVAALLKRYINGLVKII